MKKKVSIFLTVFALSFFLFSEQSLIKYEYAKEPLKVMEFDKNSRRADVEGQLDSWGIEYERSGAYGDPLINNLSNVFYNKFGGGATCVYRKLYFDGFCIEKTNFYYSRGGRLEAIEMFVDETYSFTKVKQFFDRTKMIWPERGTIVYHTPAYPNKNFYLYVQNGENENESAVFEATVPYSFVFFFHGKRLDWYSRANGYIID